MAKDPGFIFYPGDYLRDTQNLSEKAQVAYDRIMCEHMRNICIRQEQVNFFTKRLNEDEKAELMFILAEVNGGYQIEWVALSINKRKAYSESRSKNRAGKKEDKISPTYVKHMENEIENESDTVNKKKGACLMKNSGVQLQDIAVAFKQVPDIAAADPNYYFHTAWDWSESKGEMRKDWVATLRNFARRDLKDGKMKLSNHKQQGGSNISRDKLPEGYGKPSPTAVPMPKSIKDSISKIGK